MATYEVTLIDRAVEMVEGADTYQQEGNMTTFFATSDESHAVDCWSLRVASFRTSELLIVRRVDRVIAPPAEKALSPFAPVLPGEVAGLRSA